MQSRRHAFYQRLFAFFTSESRLPSGKLRLLSAMACLTFAFFFFVPRATLAGFGPENTLVVVNARSWASRTLANHYIHLRRIPPINVIYLDWQGSYTKTDIDSFRRQLLVPILDSAQRRKIDEQIDCICWSAGFPYEIDFSDEGNKGKRFQSGSITGLTYLYQLVLAQQSKSLATRNTNRYASTTAEPHSSRGFRHQYSWRFEDDGKADQGQRYLLSTMLGYTHGRGNSVEEAVGSLRRSAIADGTHPDGTIYFMTNADVRTKTRSSHFEKVAAAIRREGGKAVIEEGMVPTGKTDVIGAMTGHAAVRWDTNSKMLPGAICENLTSFGGILRYGAGQRPLTDFIEQGAAGSSGTVIEPFAILQKFPHPVLHLHYRRGCTLAESFYGSVAAPYQLLVVGDPLCRPYANIPTVNVSGLPPTPPQDLAKVTGEVRLKPSIADGKAVKAYELYVDGRRRATIQTGGEFVFDSTRMPDGYHELRVIAIMDDGIETIGRWIKEISVDNRGKELAAVMTSPSRIVSSQAITIGVQAPDSNRILVFQNQNLLADTNADTNTITLSAHSLGYGPVRLIPAGLGESKLDNVFARPIHLEIIPGPRFPARPSAISAERNDGLLLTRANGKTAVVTSTGAENWLKKAGVQPGERFDLQGTVDVERTSVYYLQISSKAKLGVTFDGIPLIRAATNGQAIHYDLPLLLEKGSHRLRLSGRADEELTLSASFGEDGTAPLRGPTFKHVP